MKIVSIILAVFHMMVYTAHPQQTQSAEAEQQLEAITDAEQAETEDDSWLLQMETFRKHPVDLNRASADELSELKILHDLQIENLLSYRNLLGKLISIYELQAVPGWDIFTIRRVLPFVTVSSPTAITEEFGKRLGDGDHSILLRYAQVLEKTAGYDLAAGSNHYLGKPGKIFFRYRYQYKNLLQYGLVGDKDAGEQFFRGAQQYGFDFYSVHVFVRKLGILQSLAIGDFTVNMGQGLIQWQGMAFRKGVDITAIKRQSPVLKPYNSAGEFNFHRGMGITVRKKAIETTLFISYRKLNANIIVDTLHDEEYFSSFLASGNNRTAGELEDRHRLGQLAYGANLSWNNRRLHIGLNNIIYRFSLPLQKRPELYNLYAMNGRNWNNTSLDYSYTYHNLHFFGEAAVDRNMGKAIINGLLISMDARAELSLVHRYIGPDYQSLNSSAFTENSTPVNENGLFAGIRLRPLHAIRLDLYADLYKFPWLKYRVNAPSCGKDFFVQLTYTPNKQIEIYSRFRSETKQGNEAPMASATSPVNAIPKKNWRTQLNFRINKSIMLRNRFEMIWYNKGNARANGFLAYLDCIDNPPLKPWSGSVRIQYFDSDSYDARLYAYENDLMFSYSIPVFSDKGFRYYLNFSYNLTKHLSFWLKWSQSLYPELNSSGSGTDAINGNQRKELKGQIIIHL